jgi:hypothetical protein
VLGRLTVTAGFNEGGHVAGFIGGSHGLIIADGVFAVVGRSPHSGEPAGRLRWDERPMSEPAR